MPQFVHQNFLMNGLARLLAGVGLFVDNILLEDASNLLLEDGSVILLE